MKEGYYYWTFIFYFLLVFGVLLQKRISSHARKLELVDKSAFRFDRNVDDMIPNRHMDTSLNVFFTPNDLKAGKTIPIFFPIKNQSQIPKLLPKEVANSIPFSVSNISHLLEFFSISPISPQANAMKYTLTQCELEPMREETKFCATSLESLLDSTRYMFGLDIEMKAMMTRYPSNFKTQLQNYTIMKEPKKIWSEKIVSCHTMPYPYMVFYCHSQTSDNMLYDVSLRAVEKGEEDRIEGVAICHMDTSEWDKDHVVFRVMNLKPGDSSICHFYPADNIAWIPSSARYVD